MTRRLKRLPEFDLSLQLKSEGFLKPPRDAQKNWILNRAMNEFAQDIYALDKLAALLDRIVNPAPENVVPLKAL